MVVTLLCIGSDTHDVVYPNDGDDHEVTLPNDGTIPKHIQSVSYVDQDMDPKYSGPSITDDNYSGKNGKRDDLKPAWSTVAPLSRELKAYWHEWDTIELKDDILYKKRFRDVGNDAEYLFLMPAVLRKETFRQLHANVTGGHLGRRKT